MNVPVLVAGVKVTLRQSAPPQHWSRGQQPSRDGDGDNHGDGDSNGDGVKIRDGDKTGIGDSDGDRGNRGGLDTDAPPDRRKNAGAWTWSR
jgi:hypothetical protein